MDQGVGDEDETNLTELQDESHDDSCVFVPPPFVLSDPTRIAQQAVLICEEWGKTANQSEGECTDDNLSEEERGESVGAVGDEEVEVESDQKREVDASHGKELEPPTLKSALPGVVIWRVIEDEPRQREDAFCERHHEDETEGSVSDLRNENKRRHDKQSAQHRGDPTERRKGGDTVQ